MLGRRRPNRRASKRYCACTVDEAARALGVSKGTVRCAACGEPNRAGHEIVLSGAGHREHSWLHAACWTAWYESRMRAAVTTLTAVGGSMRCHFPSDFGKNGST